MLMNLLIVKEGKSMWHTCVHSNHHHLKIIKNVVDHFRYNFIGGDVGAKNKITAKKLMNKITNLVIPFEIHNWETGVDLRKIDNIQFISGFILMVLNSKTCNDIYMDIGNNEPDDELVYERLKIILRQIRRRGN